jgi:hypothetical protein
MAKNKGAGCMYVIIWTVSGFGAGGWFISLLWQGRGLRVVANPDSNFDMVAGIVGGILGLVVGILSVSVALKGKQ